jgi:MFS family permease
MMHSVQTYPAFRLLMAGTLATNSAFWMYQVAVGWLALETTDSPFYVGLSGFAGGIPMLIFSIPAGVLIDRFDGRSVLLAAQAGVMLVALGFAAAIMLDLIRPWLILVLAFLYGSAMSFVFPSRTTIVPSLVERADLSNAIALNAATQNATRVIGPSIAGVLIATIGTGSTFAFAAALQIIALSSSIRLPSSRRDASSRQPMTLSSLAVGFRIVAQSRFLTGLVLLALAPTVLVMPYLNLMPVFARDEMGVGSGGLGLLLASTGIGTVCGALIVARSVTLQASTKAQFVTVMLFTLFVILFAITQQFALGMILLFLAGLMSAAWLALNQTALQLHVSDEVRGRVLSVYLMTWGMLPLGQLFVGTLADITEPGVAVVIACLLSTLCVLYLRRTFSEEPAAEEHIATGAA